MASEGKGRVEINAINAGVLDSVSPVANVRISKFLPASVESNDIPLIFECKCLTGMLCLTRQGHFVRSGTLMVVKQCLGIVVI